MRLGDERLIAILAGEFPNAHMDFPNMSIQFGTEEKFFVAIPANLLPVLRRLLMASQHVFFQVTFDDGLVRTLFAGVFFRVGMEYFVTGKHVAL